MKMSLSHFFGIKVSLTYKQSKYLCYVLISVLLFFELF